MSFCWFPKTANYFYPHPPRGGRHKTTVPCLGRVIFLSTPSARRATDRQKHSSRTFTISIHALREEGDGMCWGFPRRRPKFLSTPSARRATPKAVKASVTMSISIHALREEGDVVAHPAGGHKVISIHALREEGDQEQLLAEINRRRFLSTPSARRATCSPLCRLCTPRHFYPRPPRGGRPGVVNLGYHELLFLSTPSARRATNCNE